MRQDAKEDKKQEDLETRAVLLKKDRDSRAIRTQVLESKGVACEEAVEAALRVINEFGHRGKIILKADAEPACKALREQVLRRMDGGGLAAQPVAHEHKSNGSVENGVKIFQGLFRVHLIALEKEISSHIPIDHPILSWLVEFVGENLTKYLQGADGKTAYERLYGKKIREEHLEFRRSCLVAQTSRSGLQCGCRSPLGVWSLGRTEVGHTPPFSVSWQPRATG